MKYILIFILIAVGVYFSFSVNINKTINFNNEEYKISQTEGKDGFYKFHYTKSGRDTGLNNFIEILKFDKPNINPDKINGVASFIKKTYKTKYVSGALGEFGIFGSTNKSYAYTIKSETNDSYWFINYVVKSGNISSSEAKRNSVVYINNLKLLASELEN